MSEAGLPRNCVVSEIGPLTVGLLALLLSAAGCDPSTPTPGRGPATQRGSQSGLFDSVADNLDHLEQFDVNQMLPQITDRLNQWYQQEKPKVNWQLDPLVSELPQPLQKLPITQTLDAMQFRVSDAWFLQQTVWQRDISKQARGDRFADLDVAGRLFDWTICNIALEPRPAGDNDAIDHSPAEILLFGRGSELDRAWIFMLLARQQGLDVVMLGIPQGAAADPGNAKIGPWCTALVAGDQLYLFDCRLGLPIPGPGGQGVATLEQLAADDGLLRALDVDQAHPYPVRATDLEKVVAYVEGSPPAMSKRMALVESRLTGKRRLTLTAPASAIAERVKKIPHVGEVRLWPHPFEVVAALGKLTDRQTEALSREMYLYQAIPNLLTARSLYFKGHVDGENGAKRHLLNSRPANTVIENWRMPDEAAKKIKPEARAQMETMQAATLLRGKQAATYWLALTLFEQQDYAGATEYLERFILKDDPRSRWTPAARYLLGRCYEARGDREHAIALYESDPKNPQADGNRLRARGLKSELAAAGQEAKAEPPASP